VVLCGLKGGLVVGGGVRGNFKGAYWIGVGGMQSRAVLQGTFLGVVLGVVLVYCIYS